MWLWALDKRRVGWCENHCSALARYKWSRVSEVPACWDPWSWHGTLSVLWSFSASEQSRCAAAAVTNTCFDETLTASIALCVSAVSNTKTLHVLIHLRCLVGTWTLELLWAKQSLRKSWIETERSPAVPFPGLYQTPAQVWTRSHVCFFCFLFVALTVSVSVFAADYGSAIETLVTAISLIKQSKVSADDRCKVLISSLQDCLHGIESKSYGSASR